MTRSFIQLWTRAEFEIWKSEPNTPLIYAASNQFKQRGITKGDQLFIVACFSDALHLMGCLRVDMGVLDAVAAKNLLPKNSHTWARDYVFHDQSLNTRMRFDLQVPKGALSSFRFADGSVPKFKGDTTSFIPDPQTFRGVRELSIETANNLARLLGANQTARNQVASAEPEKIRALSIRQPYAERILRGDKKIEYRTWPTTHRGKIYIYAAKTPVQLPGHEDPLDPLKLPRGVLVGTVEIVNCKKGEKYFEWGLKNPVRFNPPQTFNAFPQAGYFYPFGKQ
jgi:hypothetical protein